jgi:RecJ-like exonuclease
MKMLSMADLIERFSLHQCVMCHRTGTVNGIDPCETCGGFGIIGVQKALTEAADNESSRDTQS